MRLIDADELMHQMYRKATLRIVICKSGIVDAGSAISCLNVWWLQFLQWWMLWYP